MNAVVAKAALAVVLAPLSLDPVRRWLERHFVSRSAGAWTTAFLVSRLTLCLVVFGVLGVRLPSDASHYYAGFGQAVLQSGRAAASPYSPVFDYLMAGLLWTFRTPLGILVMLIAAEAAAFGVTASAVRAANPALAVSLAALWFVTPLSVLNIALGGQDEALIVLALAGVLWAALRRRDVAAGMFVAAGLVLSKVLAVFAALPLVVVGGRRLFRSWAVAFAALASAVVVLSLSGLPVWGFLVEARRPTSGNIWAVASLLAGFGGPAGLALPDWSGVMIATTVAAIGAALYFTTRSESDIPVEQMLRVVGTVGCTFLLFSVKAFPSYLVMFLPGVLFLILKTSPSVRTLLVLIFMPLAVIESSVWFAFEPWGDAMPVALGPRAALGTIDTLLVASYVLLAWQGMTNYTFSTGV